MDINVGVLAGGSLLCIFYLCNVQRRGKGIGEVFGKNKGNWDHIWGQCVSFRTGILEDE